MVRLPAIFLLVSVLPAAADRLDASAIERAAFAEKLGSGDRLNPLTVKLEILLDRANFSPGEIDGRRGENLDKALKAYSEAQGISGQNGLGPELWAKLTADSAPVLTTYRLTNSDIKGPFLEKIPAKLEDMKGLPSLGYRNAREKIAERFHMSEELLTALNPGVKFDQPQQEITVASVVQPQQKPAKASRVEVNKQAQTVKVFAESGDLLAFYPATVGSEEKPTPNGTLKVVSIDRNPTYRYNPEYKFKGVESASPFVIRPGPNNPVGSEWIGLSEKSYGIHGTPDPSKVSKSESHGCVRLTNWDVERLGKMLRKGVPVTFLDDPAPTTR